MPKIKTDIARWKETAKHNPTWIDRNVAISKMILPQMAVLDIGAGNMNLKGLIDPSCVYQPMDCIDEHKEVIVYDFNSNTIPPSFDVQYDFIICSGVLEYISNIPQFLATIKKWGNEAIISYAILDRTPNINQRTESGWVNHLNETELLAEFSNSSFVVTTKIRWQSQMIYKVNLND